MNNTPAEHYRIVSMLSIMSGQVSRFICFLQGKKYLTQGFSKSINKQMCLHSKKKNVGSV